MSITPEIEVERYEANQIIGQRWRIHSYHDGDSIMLTDQGMRELLDELLKIARQFGDQEASEEEDEDEAPKRWQIRTPKAL